MSRRLFGGLFLACLAASASVVRVELVERSDVLDGRSMGPAGPYERIVAKVHFAVDPKLAPNQIISDINLAPRDEDGFVEFSSDLYMLKPHDPDQGNGTVLFEVCNRGRKGMLGMFNRAGSALDPRTESEFGDRFLLEQGFTLVWLGWQFDVPHDPKLMRLYAPVARDSGQPITGPVRSEFIPDKKTLSFSLADRTMIAYPVADPGDKSLQLTVRDTVEGCRRTIPRNQWRFARDENGKPIPDRTHVFMASGFVPGNIYEIVYKAQDPVLVGLGPAAVRDFISFLKYGSADSDVTLLGDQRRYLKRAIGFGVSQSGRFLRTFLYYGFNQDEQNRRVFDGVWAHVAGGGRGSFNHRFAQPSRDAHPFFNLFYPTDIFPFTDLEETDPETGLGDGILVRAERAGVTPKIFYTNSAYEYWGRAASLIHTTLDGKRDAPLAENTRIYLFAGSQHGPAAFPPRRHNTENLANPNDFRWSMRALLVAMNSWVTSNSEPPASRYPRISRDELVPLRAVSFPNIPGIRFTVRLHKAYRVDYGPEFRTKGIVAIEPPKVGKAFPMLVPQVDADGNDTSGIRLPEVQVPLATYTGWNLRVPEIGAPDELYSMAGSFIPFPRTEPERKKNRDPRPSVEERYKSRQDYLDKFTAATGDLVRNGYLLQRDVPHIIERGTSLWDYLMGSNQK
jgi:hypothetical protein